MVYKLYTLKPVYHIVLLQVSAVSAVYVIMIGILLPATGAWTALSHICQIWTALVLISKTIYQLTIIEKGYWYSNCTVSHSIIQSPY